MRYDGGHKLCPRLAALRLARWLPVCPEVLAGFGVPRPAMELRRKDGAVMVVRCEDGLDCTSRLRDACLQIARDALSRGIRGAVVKSASPSCAVGNSPLFLKQGGSPPRPDGVGLLVQALRESAPDLPVIDEAAFEDVGQRAAFFSLIFRRIVQ